MELKQYKKNLMIKLTREHFVPVLNDAQWYMSCVITQEDGNGIEICIEPLHGGYYVALYEHPSKFLIMEKDYLGSSGHITPEFEQKLVDIANKQLSAYAKFINPEKI